MEVEHEFWEVCRFCGKTFGDTVGVDEGCTDEHEFLRDARLALEENAKLKARVEELEERVRQEIDECTLLNRRLDATAEREYQLKVRVTELEATHYLPMDCPCCGRRRLEYSQRTHVVKCEKCGAENWEHPTPAPTP